MGPVLWPPSQAVSGGAGRGKAQGEERAPAGSPPRATRRETAVEARTRVLADWGGHLLLLIPLG